MVNRAALGLLWAVALILTPAPAAAQPAAPDNPYELSFGFSRQKWNSDGLDSRGFGVDFGRMVHTRETTATLVYVDFARNVFANVERDMSIVGGIREKFLRDRRVFPFVHASAGLMRWKEDPDIFGAESGTEAMVGGGGGVQINLHNVVDFKIQMDFWAVRNSTVNAWDPVTRLYFAAVFKFGSR